MTLTGLHFPDESINPPGPDTFFNSSTAQPNAWQDVDNGVATPDDGKSWWCFGDAKSGDVKFDWTGVDAGITEVTTFWFTMRWTGFTILELPSCTFELWTDHPTPLARLVKSITQGMGNGATGNGSIIFDNISMTRDELINTRVRLIPINGGPGDPPPGPKEEP